jgi:UDP-3-O-[3-hydroxymyristoyl] N-acetylglucosamine deacetylase
LNVEVRKASLQATIAQPIELNGCGVHSGIECKMRLLPSAENSGVVFYRTDLPGSPAIPARLEFLSSDDLLRRTTIGVAGAKVYTIEHLMSAAAGLGVTNLRIEMNAEETPFLDGSALPFVKAIQSAGICEQQQCARIVRIPRPLVFQEGDSEIVAVPGDAYRITFFFTSNEPLLRTQANSFEISPEVYATAIAPARTFCFFHEIEQLRQAKLISGGNLSNAVVIGRKSILNNALRFPDEPVRHKILDFIGDASLLGVQLKGHILAWRAGHRVNAAFALWLRKELCI